MKTTIIVAALLFAAASATSCGNSQRQDSSTLPARIRPLSFEQSSLVRNEGDCSSDTMPCITIRIRRPVAVAGTDSARSAINRVLDAYVHKTLAGHVADSTEWSDDIDSLVATLFADYRSFVKEAQEYRGFVTPWEITIEGKVLHRTPAVVSVEMSTYSYTGGAHPNYWTAYKNFDPRTGRLLAVQDLVVDTVRLTALAEQEFRRSRNLRPTADLEEAGYWFPNNRFALPVNTALTNRGVLLLYNPYEVASYAEGPIEVLLPYDKLQEVLAADYLKR